MNYDDYEFIVAAYDGRETATEALKTIKTLQKEGSVSYKDAVAVYKTDSGKVKLSQAKETKGIIGGGALGVLAAVLLPGVGGVLGALIGATVGGVAFKGIDNKELKQIGKELGVDESALFILVNDADWPAVQDVMPEPKAILHREVISMEVITAVAKVAENQEVAEDIAENVEVEEVE